MTPWFALLAALLAVSGDEASLTTLEGQTINGVVSAWDGTELTIDAAEGAQQLATDAIMDVAWKREPSDGPALRVAELVDGSRLAFEEFTIAKRTATFQLPGQQAKVDVPTARIKRIELVAASEPLAKMLAEIEQKQPAGDSLVIVKGEAMDYLSGVVEDVTAQQADFRWDGEKVPVKLSKIAAIVFYHAKEAALREALCRVSFTNGSVIAAKDATLKDQQLQLKSVGGVDVEFPFDQVTRIDFSSGKIAYLSDLKPATSRWTPRVALPADAKLIASFGAPRQNVAFDGSQLSLLWDDDPVPARRDVRTYSRGLAVRSRTELTYLVPEGMTRFAVTAGIDPATASQGNVALEIRGDDRILWEGTIDGGQPPVEIDVELQAARRLQLVVDYGDNLDYGDRLHLIEARFIK
ncbi:NPCBM/NEW2 domain-containing protein [Lacipirellula sp.]|uniref:NPCBM/NEW2 domain-containing protein n=1 Tax=Lacipirellula sp. TaxID=2691419 RepID=UPI003D09CD36